MTDNAAHITDLERLADRTDRQRRTQLLWTLASVAVPALVGAAVLWVSVDAVGDARHELGVIEARAETASQELAAQAIALGQQRQENERLAAENTELETTIVETTARYTALSESVDEIQTELTMRTAELETMRETFQTLSTDVASTQQELERLRQRAQNAEDELAEAIARKSELLAEIEALEADKIALARAAEQERERAATAERELEAANLLLKESTQFTRSLYNLDWGDLKSIAMQFAGAERPLLKMTEDRRRNLGWSTENTLQEGFNSPAYAAYVLQKTGIVERDLPLSAVLDTLPAERFAPDSRVRPNTGDIVVYKTGYHLFYYRDDDRNEFVVGMTPFGIVAVDYNEFELEPRAILRVPRR